MKVECDFFNDFLKILYNDLIVNGYDLSNHPISEKTCHTYFNLKKRLIEPIPRKVLFSKEFFYPQHHEKGLELIKQKVEKGESLSQHLSTRIFEVKLDKPKPNKKSKALDDLLNDWGIHHLHLGTDIYEKDKRFLARTNNLLFVRFDEQNAYFINIMPHGNWSEPDLIKIIHNNWPESIEKYKIDVQGLVHNLSTEEREKGRKNNVSASIEIEEVVYIPLGGGIRSSGLGGEVVRTCKQYQKQLIIWEKQFKENAEEILKAENYDISNYDSLKFHLEIQDGVFYAIVKNHNIKIKLT